MNFNDKGPGMGGGGGGFAPPMNPAQKQQGMQQGGPPAPQQGGQRMQPMQNAGMAPGLQGAQTMVDAQMQMPNDLAAARQELQRAQVMGADPMTILGLQQRLQALEGAAQQRMMQQQQQNNNMMTRGPGVGGASGYSPSDNTAMRNQGLDQQILASMFGVGPGGPGPNR